MNDKDKNKGQAASAAPAKGNKMDEPEWAAGLKRLYDSVVDEPLPDSFKDLLSKLDDGRKE